jgi:uncharacterized protein (UPF0212 family)
MRALSASELLSVWERGLTQSPVERALALLIAANPESAPDDMARLSIGQRDAQLLTLREWMFGSQLVSLASCSDCGEQLELAFEVSDIRAGQSHQSQALAMSAAGYEVDLRLPNSLDLAAIASHNSTEARRLLLDRCVVRVQREGADAPLDQLPEDVKTAISEQMALADPQANVELALACPACGHQWQAVFDIAAFFWSEINAWAIRLLREVHAIASAYGWREADIVTLSPMRRQLYLDMIGRF